MGAPQQALLAGSGFTPAGLFTGGTTGVFYDFTDPATLFSDTSRTTLSTVGGQIRGVTDKSGTGQHLSTASTTILRQAGTKFNYASFPGNVDGFTVTTAVGSAAGFFWCVGVRPANVASATQCALEAQYGPSTQAITQAATVGSSGLIQHLTFATDFTSVAASSANSLIVDATDYAISGYRTTTVTKGRIDGVEVATAANTKNPNSNASAPLIVGSGFRGTTTGNQVRWNGRIYAALFVNRQLTAPELVDTEAWFMAHRG
jgi:hypothetical protein